MRALQWLDGRDDVDTIIIARGGGSLEDLWAFNDERVARAIFAARHPIICGVGHETDFTIADFVADQRAPTPSAAAELAVPDLEEVPLHLAALRARLVVEMEDLLAEREGRLRMQRQRLRLLSPRSRLDNVRQRIDGLTVDLEKAVRARLESGRGRLAVARAELTAVGPQATLNRGYAIVRRAADGKVVRQVADVEAGQRLSVRVSDGSFTADVGDLDDV